MTQGSHQGFGGNLGILSELARAPSRVVDTLLTWQMRATERHQLRGLDDRLIRDMGLHRADIAREAAKPFWRA